MSYGFEEEMFLTKQSACSEFIVRVWATVLLPLVGIGLNSLNPEM